MKWWDDVNAASGGKAATFVRVFPVPGMTHCGGGPATDQYDCLTAIVDWVEQGKAPESVVATGPAFPGRSRPLCAYPQHAQYKGEGDPESAANFECQPRCGGDDLKFVCGTRPARSIDL